MKAKYTLIAFLALTFFGCDDNTGELGLGMFPGSDQSMNGKLTTFDVTTQSIPTGEIYAKTNVGYVGKFTDETFGAYEAGFLATLNCPKGLTFPAAFDSNEEYKSDSKVMVTDLTNVGLDEATKKKFRVVYAVNAQGEQTNQIIGNCQINLYLWYSSYFGDSLTACRMSIYELDKPLDNADNKVYYTNIDPDNYYDKSSGLLGAKGYTAVDMSVSDSIRNLSTYVPSVNFNFSQEITQKIGGRILTKAKELKDKFSDSFINDVFKGIYVKSDYGDGTVLYISDIRMDIASICYAFDENGDILKSKKYADKDSVVYSGRSFTATREVIQANQLKNNKEAIQECINEKTCTYLKSPAGIFTQATLPIEKIKNDLAGDTLNAVKLSFSNYNQSSNQFGMSIPTNVMLIRERYKDSFFENNQLADNVNSFLSSHTGNTNQYTFSNITRLIKACLADKEAAEEEFDKNRTITIKDEKGKPILDKDGKTITASSIEEWETKTQWDKVVLIPVLITYDNSNSYSSNVISIKHDLKPGYVKLKGGKEGETNDAYKLKLEVISTNFAARTK